MAKNDPAPALVLVGETALVVTNPNVQALARRLRWKPETMIARIKRALPAPVEQQIYLALAPDAGESSILPESMVRLLRMFLGHQELRVEDLAPGAPGNSRFTSFVEFLGECLNLLKIVTEEYSAFQLSIEDAGLIALTYGDKDPERLIEMVDCNLEEMCEMVGISNNIPYQQRMRMCVWLLVEKIIPENQRNGVPDLLDLTDFLTMSSGRRHQLRRILADEEYFKDENLGEYLNVVRRML